MAFGETPDSLEQCVEDWLAAYASEEVEHILPFYHSPLLVITTEEWHWLTGDEEVEQFITSFVEDLQSGDYASSDTDEINMHYLTDADVLVSLSLSRYDTDGEIVDRFGFTDLFHHTDDGWKAAVAVAHGPDAVIS